MDKKYKSGTSAALVDGRHVVVGAQLGHTQGLVVVGPLVVDEGGQQVGERFDFAFIGFTDTFNFLIINK